MSEPLLQEVILCRLMLDGHELRAVDPGGAVSDEDPSAFDACVLDAPGTARGALAPCRALRMAGGSDLQIVLLTPNRHATDRRAALEAGADVVHPLPVDPDLIASDLAEKGPA